MRRLGDMRWATLGAAAIAIMASIGCTNDVGTVRLVLVRSPVAADEPLDGLAEQLRIRVSGAAGSSGPVVYPLSAGAAEIEGVPAGGQQKITVEGLGPDGNVVSRGQSGPIELGSGAQTVEIYVGRVERFSQTPTADNGRRRGMLAARAFHQASLVQARGGPLVLLTGGVNAPWRPEQAVEGELPGIMASVERIDVPSLRFAAVDCAASGQCMADARLGHSATVLPTGNVLIAGGQGSLGDPLAVWRSTELFSAAERRFFEGPPLEVPRSQHGSTLQGEVVALTGGAGFSGVVSNSSEGYSVGRIRSLPQMRFGRRNFALTSLSDGTVVATGGMDQEGQPLPSTEFLAPGSPQWQSGPSLAVARAYHTSDVVGGDALLIVGGLTDGGAATASIELLDLKAGVVQRVGELQRARWAHTTTAMASAELFVVGGFVGNVNGSPSNAYERIVFGSAGLVDVRAECCLRQPRAGHTAVLLPSGALLVAGGVSERSVSTPSGQQAVIELLDTAEVYIP